MLKNENNVLVVGAGMAGLSAARALAETGLKVLVIEAQDRIGGRILTKHLDTETIELGAEFIHGRPEELWALIDEIGLETYERGGAQFCFENGALSPCHGEMDGVFEPLEKLKTFDDKDISFEKYLDREQSSNEERNRVLGYVEGFNAADSRDASAAALGVQQKAEDAINGDRIYKLRGGYDQLPQYLVQRIVALGNKVLTGTTAKEIRWEAGQVEIVTSTEIFRAEQAVVTLPLGILQSGDVLFSPAPEAILEAANLLRMGQVRRFTLMFTERFWMNLPPRPALGEMSFLYSFSEMPPVWWTPHPEPSNTITGWIGGPRSAVFQAIDPQTVGRKACISLAKIFGLNAQHIQTLLHKCYTHDWQQDPFAKGAYSYVATGGLDASKTMTTPLENTLFFAGEHTDVTGHWGTVHAAMRSGLRAAAQIVQSR